MSLWAVPDELTAALMQRFYSALWTDSVGPAEALRRAHESVRAQWPEPVNWAAWVVAGEAW